MLIIVLGMIMALSVILFNFNHSARSHLRTAGVLVNSHRAANCTHTGLNVAIAAIREHAFKAKGIDVRPLWWTDKQVPLEQGSCTIELTPEDGRLNVNRLKDADGRLDHTRINQVLRLIDLLNSDSVNGERISYDIVPAIIDWIDNDDEVTYLSFVKNKNAGAESEYYRTFGASPGPKNRVLDTCSELLQVRGITPSVFQRLKDHITVKGEGKIDINCASKLILQCFSHEIDLTLAQIIINRRLIKPYTSLRELSDLPGMTASIHAMICKTAAISPTSLYYRVLLTGTADGIHHHAEAMLRQNTETRNVDIIYYVEI